jgi:hypothetical protein
VPPSAAPMACSPDYTLLRPVLLELERWYPRDAAQTPRRNYPHGIYRMNRFARVPHPSSFRNFVKFRTGFS